MRSSSFSSTKSSNKYDVKERVVCPVSKMKSIGNKRNRENNEELVVCDGQVQVMSFVTYDNGQFVADQQALAFLAKTSRGLDIQFMAFLGCKSIRNHFIAKFLNQSKQKVVTGIQYNIKQDFQYKNEGIFMYNFTKRKANKLLYFIGLDQTEEHNISMLQLLSFLSSGLTICVSHQERKENFLQRLLCHLKDSNSPSNCYLIYSKKIVIGQDLLQKLESSFDELILTSFDAQNDCASINRKVELYMHSISSLQARKQQSRFLKAKYIKNLIHNRNNINQREEEISFLANSIYNQLLAEINAEYEEFFNQLNFQLLQDRDKLIEELQRQQDKKLRQFNADILDSQFHQLYLQKLLDLIEEHQAKIIASIEQSAYEKVEYSMENTGELQKAEIENEDELLQAIEEMKEKDMSSHDKIEKVLILARNAARMNVMGYDEKAKIAQLRVEIDKKWEQLQEVRIETTMKKEEANEQNLLRQKYEMMQAIQSTLQAKTAFLSQEILHLKTIVTIQGNTADEKHKELQQLQHIHQKNKSLIQFVSKTYLQQPPISSIQSKLASISQSIKQLTFKKQLIFQSIQEHQQKH